MQHAGTTGSLLPVSHNAEVPGREGPKLPVLCRQGLVRGSGTAEKPKPAGYNPMTRSDHRNITAPRTGSELRVAPVRESAA